MRSRFIRKCNVSLEDGCLMARRSNRSMEEKKQVPDCLMNLKDIPFVRNTGGAMYSPNRTACFTSRCWIVKCMSHFSWQSTLMKSTYLPWISNQLFSQFHSKNDQCMTGILSKAHLQNETAALLCFVRLWMSLSLRVSPKKDKLGEG